ncbi:MAG: YceI family protein [Kofleriaceae bacterium]
MKKFSFLLALPVALSLAAAGCKKKEEAAPAPNPTGSAAAGSAAAGSAAAGSAAAGSAAAGSAAAGSAAAGSAAAAAESPALAGGGYFKVVADHTDASKGAVDVAFAGVKVVKADFDPAKVEGGTATLELDLATLSSGIEKRDGHLKSADYLDAEKFPTATIDIANVKKGDGDNKYTADAKIKLKDIEKTFPVSFEVVDTTPDSIRIRGEHAFSRLDFGVGTAEDENVKAELTAKVELTLKKS